MADIKDKKPDVNNRRSNCQAQIENDLDNEILEEKDEPIAPDGGFGWVVMIASFFASVIVDGTCFAFGIFYLEFLDIFQEDRSKTAWIGSVLNGMYMVTAPLSGACAKMFGCRPVAIVGAIWASCAFICSTFSKNVNTLILTYGVLGGFGFGLMYLPSIVMVGFYFDKRRAFATGIATCGSGIGAFILAPLCEALIQYYGWQGAQWIVSGIVLNGVLLGALYRPLTEKDIEECKIKWRKKHNLDNALYEKEYDVAEFKSADGNKDYMTLNGESEDTNLKHKMITGSMLTLASVDDNINTSATDTSNMPKWKQILHNLAETMDITVLKIAAFDIYGLSCILCMAGFFVPFTYLPDLCLNLGYSKSQGAFLLSILGITNTVGRIIAGWLSDRSWADCLLINNVALIIGGLATVLCPFCKTYVLLCIYSTVFGMCIAAFVTLRSIILVDLIGISRLTSSFGIIVLCQGISSFFGSPLAGWLYDVTNTYDLSFYVAGSTIALSGIICLPLRKIAKCQQT